MIKKAIEYIVDMAKPEIQDIKGETYSDKQLYRIDHNPKATTLQMTTLSSMIEYITSGVDVLPKLIVHVASPTRVLVYSELDYDRKREYFIEVNAQVPTFEFNRFMGHEQFCINLQSKCEDTLDRALLLKFAGTVEAGTVAEYGDDGITQKATVKTGIASKGEAIVPSPVTLTPFRTFPEVLQPKSEFIFRMKDSGGIQCALFEADGGAWKLDAMRTIKSYLEEMLKDMIQQKTIIVIS